MVRKSPSKAPAKKAAPAKKSAAKKPAKKAPAKRAPKAKPSPRAERDVRPDLPEIVSCSVCGEEMWAPMDRERVESGELVCGLCRGAPSELALLLAKAMAANDVRAALVAIRDVLADRLDGRCCVCKERSIDNPAAVAKQLVDVIARIEALPKPKGSASGDIKKERAARRAGLSGRTDAGLRDGAETSGDHRTRGGSTRS